jgi:hypothetical protein
LAKELLQKLKAFQRAGVEQRLAIAAFVTGAPRDTSWMKEGTKDGVLVREPDDKCYKICKMMASRGFIKAMDSEKADNMQAETKLV